MRARALLSQNKYTSGHVEPVTQRELKMSLCNTFRLSVVCFIIVLSSIDAPVVAFTLHRTTRGIDSNRDLAQEESVQLEVKRELNVPVKIPITEDKTTENIIDNFTPTNPRVELERDIVTEPDSKHISYDPTTSLPNETLVSEQTTVDDKVITTESSVDFTTSEFQTMTTDSILENTTPILVDKTTELETKTYLIDLSASSEININEAATTDSLNISASDETTTEESSNDEKIKNKQDLESTEIPANKNPKKSRPTPKWKNYTIIERKRPSQLSEEKIKERRKDNNEEDILKAETKHVHVTLQDTVTSDIPSLESLKNDLLSATLQTSESKNSITLKSLVTEESISTPISLTPLISSPETMSAVGHESKRAGFLNLSGKTTTKLTTDITTTEITEAATTEREKSDILKTTNEPRIYKTENPDVDVQEDKSKIESQIVLNEDAIKEELMKEELIIDSQENAKRQREESVNKSDLTGIKNVNSENSAETNSSSELSVKPINSDRSKNNTLYAVNPNYKPMKKIEVVPPKQFVRDPDDNSWRNESLSSLGIVFKPKNSSKPFTQVLKNKTETEWNNLSEKDIKNELPDLRERLQKMAEKRKSKRKKIDSFGNVVYFDYEENSSSAEHAGVTIDELTSTVSTYLPALQSSSQSDGPPTEGSKNTTEITSPVTTEGVNRISYSTRKPNKFLHEYYDSTDEDDSDYLNMAQIDLKKFSTSLRTSTPFHPSTIVAKQPVWLKNSNKLSSNAFPERKATVQYFPPLTTQKVNFNEYDDDFKYKMESFTTPKPEAQKPVSIDRPTTPVTVNTVASKSDYTKNLILTQPHLTTDPSIALINDGSFDRGTYVIKHYKDFLHEAAKDAEYDKNLGYIPFTEAPVEDVTKGFIRYEKENPRTIDSGYEYEPQFRKDVLQRFVDNFNRHSERYRSDYPIIFNSSIIHGGMHHGRDLASSRAFMRGSYNSDIFKPKFSSHKTCEPNCEKLTVELSPAYELHYYVPDQEEKEEAAPQPVTLPYKYTL